jgi:predicted metal-binding membrane protein
MASALFLTAGYLAVWIAFSIAATRLQWALDRADLLTGQIAIRSAVAAGWLVIAVGLHQLTALKQACLRHCRSCTDRRPPRRARKGPIFGRRKAHDMASPASVAAVS